MMSVQCPWLFFSDSLNLRGVFFIFNDFQILFSFSYFLAIPKKTRWSNWYRQSLTCKFNAYIFFSREYISSGYSFIIENCLQVNLKNKKHIFYSNHLYLNCESWYVHSWIHKCRVQNFDSGIELNIVEIYIFFFWMTM